MRRPRLELADIIRSQGDTFLDEYGHTLSPEQRRALRDIARCRTAELGGHIEACDECGHRRISYNSCRNRHCPKCQGTAAAQWVDAQAADGLDTDYYHVVFTLPAALSPLVLQNPRVVYNLLFRAVAETLQQVAADPKHLGAEIGFVAVLHTWGQALQHHPHVHCVVPGGGLSPDGARWIACPRRFFLPVRVLSRVFRGKLLARLRAAHDRGRLAFHGRLKDLAHTGRFGQLLAAAARSDWVVYAQPPAGGPERVWKYLARYIHRVAISNRRLIALEDGRVRFRYKDYARGGKRRVMTLAASEFLRRFLQHVLPAGFVRIRHYGFLANRCRREKVTLCRRLLAEAESRETSPARPPVLDRLAAPVAAARVVACPVCGRGRMVVVAQLPPRLSHREAHARPACPTAFDTS
jgi:hypothetical protein